MISRGGEKREFSTAIALTIETAGDRVRAVDLELRGRTWSDALDQLRRSASAGGWSEDDVSLLADRYARARAGADHDPGAAALTP